MAWRHFPEWSLHGRAGAGSSRPVKTKQMAPRFRHSCHHRHHHHHHANHLFGRVLMTSTLCFDQEKKKAANGRKDRSRKEGRKEGARWEKNSPPFPDSPPQPEARVTKGRTEDGRDAMWMPRPPTPHFIRSVPGIPISLLLLLQFSSLARSS